MMFFRDVPDEISEVTQASTASRILLKSILAFFLSTDIYGYTFPATQPDSTLMQGRKFSVVYGIRFHSKGFSPLSGFVGDGAVVDVSANLEFRKVGFFTMKSTHLTDGASPYNYAFGLLYVKFPRRGRFTFKPQAGVVLGQRRKFADPASDFAAVVMTTYSASSRCTIEHVAVFTNCVVNSDRFDWVNRVSIAYTHNKVEVAARVWHKDRLLYSGTYTRYGLSVGYNQLMLSNHYRLSLNAAYVLQPLQNDSSTRANTHQLSMSMGLNIR